MLRSGKHRRSNLRGFPIASENGTTVGVLVGKNPIEDKYLHALLRVTTYVEAFGPLSADMKKRSIVLN